MASRLALSLVIGGAVASSVGAAFKTVESGIEKLEAKGNKAKVLKSTIGETIKLREEWKRAHDSGTAGADKLLRKLDSNLDALRKQGVEVGRLSREYQRLGREARAADLQLKGHQQLQAGKESLKSNIGKAVVATGAAAVPTMISANYQAIIRDIAIKADIVNKPQEQQLNRTVIDTSKDTGMARNDVADLVNQLVGAGMELDKALSYAPVAAKFAIGQGASGVDTASMIQALEQNAKISDPKVMQQALEAIAYQGQAGSFEASDMAKWFPQLLAGMEKNGITGLDAVTSLGSMLQVQMKTAGSSDEAANNFKNWMEKIGAGDIKKAYSDVGIDYQASLNTGLQKGMNVIEASMALAMKYVEATDPAKANKIKDAQAKIDKEVDPEKAKAALEALEKTLRTGDIFADMQVKAALTAYGQNRGLYEELKADSKKASGILDKNLAERRETSAQQWAETVQAADDAMRSIGDAIRPATDLAAKGLTSVARGITSLSESFPSLVLGVGGVTAAVLAFMTASSALKVGRGVFNIARGRGLEGLAGRVGRSDRAPIELPKTGSKVVDTGLGLLGKVFSSRASEPASANDPVTGGGDTQRVFVVNADAIGGIDSRVANSSPAAPPGGGSRRSRRRERRRAAKQGTPVRPVAKVEAPQAAVVRPQRLLAAPSAPTVGDELGKVARSVRGITRLAKRLPGGNVVDAGAAAIDVAINAKSQDEKAEGYGGAAGSLAGTLAGAAAGAAIGSVVPVIGTAVGGAVGAVLGGLGGESLGGWLGKRWFGDEPTEGKAESENPTAPGEALSATLQPAQERVEGKTEPSVPLPVASEPALQPPVLVDRREPVVKSVPVSPAPELGEAVRDLVEATKPVPSPKVDKPVGVPAVQVPKPVVVDNREPVAKPALGEAVRDLVEATKPVPSPKVDKPDVAPAVQVPKPVVVDNRRPVAEPVPASPAPALGEAVRDLVEATKPVPSPKVDKPDVAPAVQVPKPVVVDNRRPVAEPVPVSPAPVLGEAVRDLVEATKPVPFPKVEKPVMVPAVQVPKPVVVDNREPVTKPVPASPAPALGELMRGLVDATKPVPAPAVQVPLPLVDVSREPVPASLAPALGDAMRDLVKATKLVPVATPAVQMPEPAVVDNREPVVKPLPTSPAKLGDTGRTVATPAPVSYDPLVPESKYPYLLPALTANKVRFPGAPLVRPPAQPEPVLEPDPLPEPEPVPLPTPAPARLGDTVRAVATPAPLEPPVSNAPLNADSNDPYLLPALTANKVRFPRAPLVRSSIQSEPVPEPEPEPVPPLPATPAKLGDTVRVVATAVPVEPPVSYDPLDPESKDPYLLPALSANKVRFPGAPLVRPPIQPEPVPEPESEAEPEPARPLPAAPAKLGDTVRTVATPAPVEPPVSYDPLDPEFRDPYLLPAQTASKVRFPGAGLVPPQAHPQPAPETPPIKLGETLREVPAKSAPAPVVVDRSEPKPAGEAVPLQAAPQLATLPAGFGDVVRDMMAKATPPAPRMPELVQPAKAAAPAPAAAPQVDQAFSFSPNIKIDVQGDVKDPAQVVREIESPLRQLFEAWQREVSARMSSTQLFDQPHV